MSTTLNEALALFNKDFVNLDPEVTKTAKASRAWLWTQLEGLPAKIDVFPRLYRGQHVDFGSFSRKTKKRQLDDIDLLLTFSGDGTTYQTILVNDHYVLRVPESAVNLRKLCNDDGTLNSIKLINLVKGSLEKIDQYKSADIYREGESASMKLVSYDWNFDIVPAFYTDVGFYIIPDGSGAWKATDPRKDQMRINAIVQKHGENALQIIRTLKFWNQRAKMATIPAYLFETVVLNFLEGKATLSAWIDYEFIYFWDYLASAIHYEVPDPKGFQGDLNEISLEERKAISSKAEDAAARGRIAAGLEKTDQAAAIRKWAEIFGSDFK